MSESLWTEIEKDRLIELKVEGKTYAEIADELNRTRESVRNKCRNMGMTNGELEIREDRSRYEPRPKALLRSAVFDLETTSFGTSGWSGHLICCSVFPLDDDAPKTYQIRFKDWRDDKRVLKDVVAALEEYDILIGHNVIAFDLGWIFSRLAHHYLPMPKKRWFYYDTYQAAKRLAIKAERKSLSFLCDYFQVPCIKTAIYPTSWSMIDSPHEHEFDEALRDITYHCAEDVKANRNLFDVLWTIDQSMQNLPRVKKW